VIAGKKAWVRRTLRSRRLSPGAGTGPDGHFGTEGVMLRLATEVDFFLRLPRRDSSGYSHLSWRLKHWLWGRGLRREGWGVERDILAGFIRTARGRWPTGDLSPSTKQACEGRFLARDGIGFRGGGRGVSGVELLRLGRGRTELNGRRS
jgi:hypothetical protein